MSDEVPPADAVPMPDTAEIAGIPYRLRVPQHSQAGPHPTLVMFHGWEGNENVTWIFAKSIGPEWLVASPRGMFALGRGFGWYLFDRNGRSDAATFGQGLDHAARFIDGLAGRYPVDRSRLIVLGFSQGAAIAYAYALSHVVGGVVSLGGFIPGTVPRPLPVLNGLPVLILHGIEDQTIAVEIARKNRDQLIKAGAEVTYLEEEVGHRVGVAGMRELGRWLADRVR